MRHKISYKKHARRFNKARNKSRAVNGGMHIPRLGYRF